MERTPAKRGRSVPETISGRIVAYTEKCDLDALLNNLRAIRVKGRFSFLLNSVQSEHSQRDYFDFPQFVPLPDGRTDPAVSQSCVWPSPFPASSLIPAKQFRTAQGQG